MVLHWSRNILPTPLLVLCTAPLSALQRCPTQPPMAARVAAAKLAVHCARDRPKYYDQSVYVYHARGCVLAARLCHANATRLSLAYCNDRGAAVAIYLLLR